MKAVLALVILAAVQMTSNSAQAMAKCEMHINEISPNPIVVTASSKSELIDAAATKCFNMYEEFTERRTGHGLQADDAGYTIANACTNVRCG